MNDLRMANNFIERYSKEKLSWLLTELANRHSTSVIAEQLGVTRQRVHQWKLAFTTSKTTVKAKIMTLVAK